MGRFQIRIEAPEERIRKFPPNSLRCLAARRESVFGLARALHLDSKPGPVRGSRIHDHGRIRRRSQNAGRQDHWDGAPHEKVPLPSWLQTTRVARPALAVPLARQSRLYALLLARFQIKGVPFNLLNNVFLKDFTLEASQRIIQRFAVLKPDFGQRNSPLSLLYFKRTTHSLCAFALSAQRIRCALL
jgi:hypothetical protein